MALMTLESIIKSLPTDTDKVIESLMKSYLNIQKWIVFHSGEKGQPEHLPHLQTVAAQVGVELAARLYAKHRAAVVSTDDLAVWLAVERIAE